MGDSTLPPRVPMAEAAATGTAMGESTSQTRVPSRKYSPLERRTSTNVLPQLAPGSSAAVGHTVENSIPLSIFPIAADKICICFCGLPGRGKTQISRRLGRYLSFFHAMTVQVYNVSEYRRRLCGSLGDAEWFDPTNESAQKMRENCNKACVQDMIDFMNSNDAGVCILDPTNPTHARRQKLVNQMAQTKCKVMFIEVTNENEEQLLAQYKEIAENSPDYEHRTREEAASQYIRKVEFFKSYFEPLRSGKYAKVESKWSFIQCDHNARHFVIHNIKGYLQQKIVNFIMNLHVDPHQFFLSRHGQSEYNDLGKIGGDSGLTQHGLNYAKKLAEWVDVNITKGKDENGNPSLEDEVPARLWTSTMRRTKETAQFISHNKLLVKDEEDDPENADGVLLRHEYLNMKPRRWYHLDELFAGDCDGMTYAEIEEAFPEEWERRKVDKLAYRYPRGESYLDVIARLEPIIIEMERHREPLLIVAHQGILRIIYAFYMGYSRSEAPHLSIPLNTVIKLQPGPFNCKEERFKLYTITLKDDGQREPMEKTLDPPSH